MSTLNPTRIAFLDYVRALAIVPVLLTHNRAVLSPGGFLGVDVFFVLSGYFITTLLSREMNLRDNITTFYIRRMCRILPLYYLSLIIYLLLIQATGPHLTPAAASISNAFLMLAPPSIPGYRMGFYWTLQVEFWFYLFFPILFFLCRPRSTKTLLFVALIALSIYASIDIATKTSIRGTLPAALSYLLLHSGEFLIGALVALYRKEATVIGKTPAYLIFGISLGAILFLYSNPLEFKLLGEYEAVYRYTTAFSTGLLVLFWCSGHANKIVLPGLGYVGLISYSLYLLHLPLLEFLSNIEEPGKWLLQYFPPVVIHRGLDFKSVFHYLLICSVAATLTYRYIEKPSIKLGRHLSHRIEKRGKGQNN